MHLLSKSHRHLEPQQPRTVRSWLYKRRRKGRIKRRNSAMLRKRQNVRPRTPKAGHLVFPCQTRSFRIRHPFPRQTLRRSHLTLITPVSLSPIPPHPNNMGHRQWYTIHRLPSTHSLHFLAMDTVIPLSRPALILSRCNFPKFPTITTRQRR